MKNNLIEEAYQKALEILHNNSQAPFGVLASASSYEAKRQQYLSIFGRDASISSLGMVVSRDKQLINTAKQSLTTLARFQAENGQIPNYVKPETKKTNYWYIGCIDATLWWLIAVDFYDKHARDQIKLKKKFSKQINKALYWAFCQEHPSLFLLQQNEASAWADNMPREGYVLYTNVLWYWVKEIYNLKNIKETKKFFEFLHGNKRKEYIEFLKKNKHIPNFAKYMKGAQHDNYYLSYVNRSFWGSDVDIFGNTLAIVTGFSAKAKSKKILKYLIKHKANKPYPGKTILNPINPKSKEWRVYMEEYATNYPHLYHNGGIWPFVGGFWILALKKAGESLLAKQEMVRLAKLNQINNWDFNEWFHGLTGKPMGMSKQSWNAAMYILAYNSVLNKIKF